MSPIKPVVQLTFQLSLWLIVIALAHLFEDHETQQALYCETTDNNTIFSQPFNTWSNVAFFVVAWFEAVVSVNSTTVYSWVAPIVLGHLALASLVHHGVLQQWTALWDVIAILIFACWEFTTSLLVFSTNWEVLSSVWVLVSLVLGLLVFLRPDMIAEADYGVPLISTLSTLIALTLFLELATVIIFPGKKALIWLFFGIAFSIPAVVLWIVSDRQPCEGVHLVGHGVWHILISLAIGCLFLVKYDRRVSYKQLSSL